MMLAARALLPAAWSISTCSLVIVLLALISVEPPLFAQEIVSDVAAAALSSAVVALVVHVAILIAWPSATDIRHRAAAAVLLFALLFPTSPLFRSSTWWVQTYVLSPRLRKTSHADSKLRVVPNRRLIFCAIEKNANTAFEDLLCSLSHQSDPAWQRWLTTGSVAATWRTWADFELPCMWAATHPDNQGMGGGQIWRALHHEQPAGEPPWTSAVFVRDPLERFLSGWLSKCTDGHDLDREVCTKVFGSAHASFEEAVAVISALDGDVPDGLAEDHFRWQAAFCNGTVGRGEFDHYYKLERDTSRDLVAEMLDLVGISDPSTATRTFDYHFAPPPEASPPEQQPAGPSPLQVPPPTMASQPTAQPPRPLGKRRDGCKEAGGSFDHVTNAKSRLSTYYSSPELVRGVLRHYAVDYRTVPGLRVPRWAVATAGEDFVRGLGLPMDDELMRAGRFEFGQ